RVGSFQFLAPAFIRSPESYSLSLHVALPISLDGDAMHFAPVAVVVVSGKVPGGAIIPERDRTGAPHEFMRELGPHAMRVELHEQRARFIHRPALEAHGEGGIDVKRLLAAQRMCDH